MDPPDVAVGGTHAFAAAHLHLARRHTVVDDELRACHGRAAHADRAHPHAADCPAQSVIGPCERLPGFVAHLSSGFGQEMGFLGFLECVELGRAAPQTDPRGRRINQVDGHQPAQPLPVLGLHDQMRESPSDRVDDHAMQVSADPVATRDLCSDCVLDRIAHR